MGGVCPIVLILELSAGGLGGAWGTLPSAAPTAACATLKVGL